jgi:hypothetical protein
VTMDPTALYHMIVSSSRSYPYFFPWKPNEERFIPRGPP